MNAQKVVLGFNETSIPVGTHICQIYGSEEERAHSLNGFMLQGVQDGEACACFSEKTDEATLASHLGEHGVDLAELKRRGAMTLAAVRDIYFQNDVFDPDRMLELLRDFHDRAAASGFSAARVIGEMSNEIHRVRGGSRLLEYESRVSLLLKECPVTAVCQYDANQFDGATIMDVLKVHPQMIVRGALVENPFFVPPEVFLGSQE